MFTKNLDIEVEKRTLTIEENRKPNQRRFYNITIFGKSDLSGGFALDQVEMNVSGQIKTPEFSLHLKGNTKFMER